MGLFDRNPKNSGLRSPLASDAAAILLAGSNIVLTPGTGTITISSTGSTTSVGLSDGSSTPIYTISGSPVTTTGTLTFTLSTQTANKVFAGPSSGGAAQPTFRLLAAADIPDISATYVPISQKGVANGVATLDAGSKIPAAQLPNTVMLFLGNWDANANSPALADGAGVNGDVYRVSVAGTKNLGSGSIAYLVGDFVIYNGTIWQKAPSADGVQSVNGAQGTVTVNAINQLTGDVTTSAASQSQSLAATIANLAVTNAKIANSTIDLTAKVTGILPVANGGTNSSTALNSNRIMISSGGAVVENAAIVGARVMFANGSGLPTGVSGLTFDSTNNVLTVTSSQTNGALSRGFIAQNNGATGFGGYFKSLGSRGTAGSPTATQSGDVLAHWAASGYGATSYGSGVVEMIYNATENWSDTANGSSIIFFTTPNTTATAKKALVIGQDQSLQYYNADGTFVSIAAAAGSGNYSLTLPAAQASGTQVLQNNGSGALSWATISASLSGLTAATATNTIANANNAQVWNWDTLSTQTAMKIASTSMTSGSLLNLTDSFNDATSTGNLLSVVSTGVNNASVGISVSSAATNNTARGMKINMSGGSGGATALQISTTVQSGISAIMSGNGGADVGHFESSSNAGATCVYAYQTAATGANYGIQSRTDSTDVGAIAGLFTSGNNSALGVSLKALHNGGGTALDVAAINNTGVPYVARLQNAATATANAGAGMVFAANRTTGGLTNVAGVFGAITDITNGAYKGALVFQTSNNAVPAEVARFDYRGNFGIGTAAPGSLLDVNGNANVKTLSETIVTKGNVTGSTTITWTAGDIQQMTLTGNITLVFSGALSGQGQTLYLKQDGTGSRTITWPGSVVWANGGTAPTMSTTAAYTDIISFLYDGTTYWGFVGGLGAH